MKQQETQLKSALLEATLWTQLLTEKERSDIPYQEARNRVIERLVKKYKNKIIK